VERPRRVCWICAALLYGVGAAGVVTLGAFLAINLALLAIAAGSAFLITAIVLGIRHDTRRRGLGHG
jgi:hypothetical protein